MTTGSANPVPRTDAMTILLVDDKPANCHVLREMLSAPNRVFLEAYSGNDALAMVLKHKGIGLVMLDVQMPEMDGFEVARILKSNPRLRELPIIFVTALSKEQHHVIRGFAEGAVDYLQKPLDLEVTQAKVRVFEKLYHYQRALNESLSNAQQINRQLERFVHTVAHDIKSPLSGMVTLLSVLNEHPYISGNNRICEYIRRLNDAAEHLTAMVHSILEYSSKSLDMQEAEPVELAGLVREVIRLLFPPANIRFHIHEPLPTIVAQRSKLQQVFQNLISNAVKYCDKRNGVVEIGLSSENNNFYEFFVRDNGPGIPEEEQADIFSLFKKGSAEGQTAESSTGVGLNILKVLVEEQGGKLRVESMPGEGATFYFEWARKHTGA